LRTENNLEGYKITSVSSQVVAGTNYVITYKNNELTKIFHVFVSLKGDISVTAHAESSAKPFAKPAENPTVKPEVTITPVFP
jgi:hypothetical protein